MQSRLQTLTKIYSVLTDIGVVIPGKYGMIVEAHENGPPTFGKNKKGVNEVEGRSQKMKADNNYHRRMVVWAKPRPALTGLRLVYTAVK